MAHPREYQYPEKQKLLCLASVALHIERSDCALLLVGDFYLAECLLILIDILLQSLQETLCVLGSHHYAAANLRLLHTGKHTCEVEDEV